MNFFATTLATRKEGGILNRNVLIDQNEEKRQFEMDPIISNARMLSGAELSTFKADLAREPVSLTKIDQNGCISWREML